MKYLVNFHTGAGNEYFDSLEEAKAFADEAVAYTEQPISIEDEDGCEIIHRSWYGVEYNEDDDMEDPICFGSDGFYGDWE